MTAEYQIQYQMRWITDAWKEFSRPMPLQSAMNACEKLHKVFDCRTRIVKREVVVEYVIAGQE